MSNRVLYTILLSFTIIAVRAQVSDSLSLSSMQSFEMLPLKNLWLNSSNPAGLSLNPANLPGRINFHYEQENGDFKRVQQGEKFELFSFQSQSYAKMKDIDLFGNFSYEKSFETGLDFSNTNNPYRGTPYDMIDTIGRDIYNREFFHLNAALSKPINNSTVLGMAGDLGVGVSVQEHDPRPQNKVLDIALRPGIIHSIAQMKFGMNLIYEYYNEEIDVDIIKENTYITLFKVLGPGVSLYHQAKSFNRLYKRNSLGFDGQANYKSAGVSAIAGYRFVYFNETVQDGGKGGDASWSYLRDLASLKGMDWDIYGNFLLGTGSVNHFIKANYSLITSLGIENLENLEQVGVLDQQDWVFYLYDQKYYSHNTDANLSYSFIKMKNEEFKDYSISISSNYYSYKQDYYIPRQSENYENIIMGIDGTKILTTGKTLISISMGVKYKKNIGGSQNFEKVNFLYDKLLLPDYQFMTSNYFVRAFKFSIEIPIRKFFDKIYLDTKAEFFEGEHSSSRTIASFSTGVIF